MRKLANRDLNLGHIDLLAQPPLNLIDRFTPEKQREGFGEVLSCLGDRFSLTCNIDLRAERDVAVALAFDDRGQASAVSTGGCKVFGWRITVARVDSDWWLSHVFGAIEPPKVHGSRI